MLISDITEKMILFYGDSRHDIDHFMKVYAYARTIGHLENLDEKAQTVLEIASVVHDISCPLCREKYGNAGGKYQEAESEALLVPFLAEFELPEEILRRVIQIVGRHHTYTDIDGMDIQILLEADYLVNAEESGYSAHAVSSFVKEVFATQSGLRLAESMFGL